MPIEGREYGSGTSGAGSDTSGADRSDGTDTDGTEADRGRDRAYDVVIVGGGPSGASAGVFTARAGMDTCVLDQGSSSIARCAYLENYLGFPGGIDVPTFRELRCEYAEAAGCWYVPTMASAVRHTGDDRDRGGNDESRENHGDGSGSEDTREREGAREKEGTQGKEPFVVETAEGRRLKTPRVIAATKDDTDYLEPLDDERMFAEGSYDGESHRYFDSEYADEAGRTPIPGLYIAGPLGGLSRPGNHERRPRGTGGHRGDRRLAREPGLPAGPRTGVLGLAVEGATRDEDWTENTRKFVERSVPGDTSDDRVEWLTVELRAHTDALFVNREAVNERTRRRHRRLLDHLNDDVIRAYLAEREE